MGKNAVAKTAGTVAIQKYAEGSIEQWKSNLCAAFCKWQDENAKIFDYEWAYPIATYKDHLIVEGYRRKWKVSFTEASTGFEFNNVNEVAEVYVDKSAKLGDRVAPEFEFFATIGKSYVGKNTDGADVLWVEGCATADVIDLDGEVVSKDCHVDFEKAILSGEVQLDSEHNRAWNHTFGKFTECRIERVYSEELKRDVQLFMVKGYADLGYSLGQDLKKALVDDKRTDIGFSIAGLISKDSKTIVDGVEVRQYDGIALKKISVTGNPAVPITWVGAMTKGVRKFYNEAEEAYMHIKKTVGQGAPAATTPAQVVQKTEGEPSAIVANNGGAAPATPEATAPAATTDAPASITNIFTEKKTWTGEEVQTLVEKIAAGVFSAVGGGFPGWDYVFPASVTTGMNTLRDAQTGGGTLGAWDPTLKTNQQVKSERVLVKADGTQEIIREFFPATEVVKTEVTPAAPVPAAATTAETPAESTEKAKTPEVLELEKRLAAQQEELAKTQAELEKVNAQPVGSEVVANGIGSDPLAGVGTPATQEANEALGKTSNEGGVDPALLEKYNAAKSKGDTVLMLSLLKHIPLDKR